MGQGNLEAALERLKGAWFCENAANILRRRRNEEQRHCHRSSQSERRLIIAGFTIVNHKRRSRNVDSSIFRSLNEDLSRGDAAGAITRSCDSVRE